MRFAVLLCSVGLAVVLLVGFAIESASARAATPLPPSFSAEGPASSTAAASFPPVQVASPARLSIPSIGLTAPVVGVGLDDTGAMAVPDGSTNDVGWYEAGTPPGGEGSAVLDAHVYAAFKNLHLVRAGDDLYVDTTSGGRLHFVVTGVRTYPLADVPTDLLFNASGGENLNLITCAGTYIPSIQTYDQRLVVYTRLVEG